MDSSAIRFANLDTKECLLVYKSVLDNGQSHLDVAEILASNNKFPVAISHLILGSEELIKGLLLFLEGKAFDLRKHKEINLLFNNHKARHTTIWSSLFMWTLIKHLSNLFNPGISLRKIFKLFDGLFIADDSKKWWKNAEELKQRGFYVDYNNKIILPTELSDKDYKETNGYVQMLKKEIFLAIKKVEEFSTEDLNNLKEKINEVKYDKMIAEAIQKERKNNKKG